MPQPHSDSPAAALSWPLTTLVGPGLHGAVALMGVNRPRFGDGPAAVEQFAQAWLAPDTPLETFCATLWSAADLPRSLTPVLDATRPLPFRDRLAVGLSACGTLQPPANADAVQAVRLIGHCVGVVRHLLLLETNQRGVTRVDPVGQPNDPEHTVAGELAAWCPLAASRVDRMRVTRIELAAVCDANGDSLPAAPVAALVVASCMSDAYSTVAAGLAGKPWDGSAETAAADWCGQLTDPRVATWRTAVRAVGDVVVTVGWWKQTRRDNRIFRPLARYVGPGERPVPSPALSADWP